ncbi:hypothetical protein [Actinomadura roseirufa]|uniref:hypothetical protein n=1 Tax=Actinomadura roseirufa TaxID=2094049 RepID=UPI001041A444|nr:hypothetical protein [Actinomadura roseirufa]
MELSEYGRRHRAIVVPLTAVPILAGAIGAGWAAVRPAEYRHSVDLQVPAPAASASAAMLEQNVSTFRSLVTSATVARAVAAETSVRAGRVHDGLGTGRPQQAGRGGTIVRVTWTGTSRTAAPAISRAAASAAVTELMRPALESSRASSAAASAAAASARRALARASARYGGLPLEEYRALQNQIAQLEVEREAPAGNRSPSEVARAIAVRKKRLAALAPHAMEVSELQDRVAQADRKVAEAGLDVRSGQSRLSAAKASFMPVSATARPVARTMAVLRTSAMCAGIGVLVSLGLLALVQTRRTRRELPPAPSGRHVHPVELS